MSDTTKAQFAKYLAPRTEAIVASWLEAVKADPRLVTADSLPELQLRDHVPKILASLIEALGSETQPKEEANRSAVIHGEERWRQGYQLRELLLEIYWLRTELFREAAAFATGHADELKLCSELSRLADKFLNDMESRSVARFVEVSESALHRANQEKLRLLRTVAHELRNMLNSVGLASGQLEAGDKESVEIMRRNLTLNTAHMTSVMDDLLALSNILSQSVTVKPGAFAPAHLLDLLAPSFAHMAAEKGLHFTCWVDPALGEVCSDELKVRQIVENLVHNAITFTYTGEVKVRCEALSAEKFVIYVEDTGVGIAKEDSELIFSEFYQVRPASPLRGSGLGLSIVAGLVEVLNGSIDLESAPGRGSIFKVVLPREHRP